jgi:DNA excision repair protein ERCC-2
MLESAARSVNKIADKIEEIKRTDASKLQDEYEKLVAGLAEANDSREDEDMMNSPGKLIDTDDRIRHS